MNHILKKFNLFVFSGSFRWTSVRDTHLMREVRLVEPYMLRVGSKQAGQKWKEVADNLNALPEFKVGPRDARSVRERYQRLSDIVKAKVNYEEKASGISPPESSEIQIIVEEIQEKLIDKQDDDDCKSNKEVGI